MYIVEPDSIWTCPYFWECFLELWKQHRWPPLTSFSKAFTDWSLNPQVSKAVARTSKLHDSDGVHWTMSSPFTPLANFNQSAPRRKRDLILAILSHFWARIGWNWRLRFRFLAISISLIVTEPWDNTATAVIHTLNGDGNRWELQTMPAFKTCCGEPRVKWPKDPKIIFSLYINTYYRFLKRNEWI